MNRFTGRFFLMACVTAVVAAVVQPAWAQRGRGMGRGMGMMRMFSPALVATLDEVQTDLKLTDEQKTEIDKINDDTRSKMRDLFADGGPPDRDAFQKLNEESTAQVEKALEPAQFQRLQQLTLQVNGASALNDAAVRGKLHFTDEQTTKYEAARDANRDAMQDAMDGMEDLPREERRAKRDELRKSADERLLAVLTPEQKTEFVAMKGAHLEIDLSQLRGRFGGGRGRDN